MHIHFGNEPWNRAAAFALRYEVFVLEQEISLQEEFDELDTDQRNYFVAYDQRLVLGTIRYQSIDAASIQPDRLCVKKEYRKKGIGKQLLLLLEEKALTEGYEFSILSAEKTALSFYEELGYRVTSEEFLEDGIPCVKMSKKIRE
ncbi:hypothetical protein DOK67_0003111 [Enterococcus sp. DIV0212c]|uniref:GNAT family N-acetyltransferase n=1 Tax=Enterococcus sp. DIV0212c TaxID=2230867 RepID=UPI001A9B165E|nr:GNAT family N-acetyltransferase [Enterococcus sp. DIV0212c]MBO1353241.1 GNAT family N-acetyltransferase [Enterococcus sp. DIV0212c]